LRGADGLRFFDFQAYLINNQGAPYLLMHAKSSCP
jgi:hypothetical protein